MEVEEFHLPKQWACHPVSDSEVGDAHKSFTERSD
jgi:hypothetical protein